MRRFGKHKDPQQLHFRSTVLFSVVILKVVEIAVIFIIVWKVPCNTHQDCDPTLSHNNNTTPTDRNFNLKHYEAFITMADLCAATDKVCHLCPLDWLTFSGKCYFFSEERNNWSSSREHCQRRNADLLCMETHEEEAFISAQVSLKNGHFWVGLRKLASQWKWHTGGLYHKELFITSKIHSCATFGRDMSAESCYNPNKWICEKNMTRYAT